MGSLGNLSRIYTFVDNLSCMDAQPPEKTAMNMFLNYY